MNEPTVHMEVDLIDKVDGTFFGITFQMVWHSHSNMVQR